MGCLSVARTVGIECFLLLTNLEGRASESKTGRCKAVLRWFSYVSYSTRLERLGTTHTWRSLSQKHQAKLSKKNQQEGAGCLEVWRQIVSEYANLPGVRPTTPSPLARPTFHIRTSGILRKIYLCIYPEKFSLFRLH